MSVPDRCLGGPGRSPVTKTSLQHLVPPPRRTYAVQQAGGGDCGDGYEQRTDRINSERRLPYDAKPDSWPFVRVERRERPRCCSATRASATRPKEEATSRITRDKPRVAQESLPLLYEVTIRYRPP